MLIHQSARVLVSLAQYLTDQLHGASGAVGGLARIISETLEETGYLTVPLEQIADLTGAPVALVELALTLVQGLDPPGVGARSLAECLALQAGAADRYDPAMARLIDNLDLLSKGRTQDLKRICAVDDDDLSDMIRELRAYDPKPGCRFMASDRVDAIVADIFVSRRGGGWAVELNSATLPRLLVNRTYYQELSSGPQDKQSRAWLNDCLQSANWLTRSLEQRARTILKVATEIVRQQDGFFRQGVQALRPLILRDIADAIGMHESTVSRVTTNKYIATPRGLFELKYFFTSAIAASRGGDAHSAEAVRFRIRGLIDGEPSDGTLSDERIVELLQQGGVDIARRTVAKYREAMRIPSSVQRRREKMLSL